MDKKTIRLFFLLIVISFSTTHAQTISAKVVDSLTQRAIPFANLQWSSDKGMITNEEGQFNLILDTQKPKDSVYISCIGYNTLGKTFDDFKDSIVYLSPKVIALNNVIVSNKRYTVEEIITLVQENLDKNYNRDLTKKKIFFRERYFQNLNKTNYSKFESTITAFNSQFLDSVIRTIPKTEERYTEALFELYGNYEKEKQKIALIKASELYDKNNEMDLKALETKFNKIIKENVRTDSYFKIKSGIFGSKVDSEDIFGTPVDSTDVDVLNKKLEEEQKRKEHRKKYFANGIKSDVANVFQNLIFMGDTDLNFISKARKYNYTLSDFAYIGQDAVYVIKFQPKGGADYQGILYINADDFAVVRLEYENVKSLKSFKLLGISMNEYMAKGKMLFYKGTDNRYNLRYLEKENGSSFGINRPLKIIEKNKIVKGKNKQNELSLKMDLGVTSTHKYEIVVFDTENTSTTDFDAFTENNTVLPTYMPRYNPEFWKGYNIIEPNAAIREFTSAE